MRWVRFEDRGKPAYGIVEGETIRVVKGDPFDGYEPTKRTRKLAEAKVKAMERSLAA